MQYGLKHKTMQQKEKIQKIKARNINMSTIIMLMAITFLLSRVVIYMNKEEVVGLVPFGLAFLGAILKTKDENKMIFASIGGILGYFTVNNQINNASIYIITILGIFMLSYILSRREIFLGIKSVLGIYFITQFIISILINKQDIKTTLILGCIYTVIIIPIYFIIKYGLQCFENYNTNYCFTTEELISIGIVGCLIIAGIGDINILNIEIKVVVSVIFIILIAYVGGPSNGAAMGIAMGLILGISSGSMIEGIGFYGVMGLVAGLFKETGRIFSFLSVVVIYAILSLYTSGTITDGIIEVLLGGVIFLIIPTKIIKKIDKEVNTDVKMENFNSVHTEQMKEEFSKRVDGLTEVLGSVSEVIENLSTNEALLYKDKSAAMVNNLADRICSKCNMANSCWGNQFNVTYSCFEKIIRGREDNFKLFPAELEKKCMRKYEILNEVDQLVLSMNAEAINREKIEEGRKLIANHMNIMVDNIGKMLGDFKKDIVVYGNLEQEIRKELNKNSIQYKDVLAFVDREGKSKVKVNMTNCSGCRYCNKNVLPIVSSVMNKPMSIGRNGCSIKTNNKDCTVTITEIPKYNVQSYVGMKIKEGENHTGDTYNFGTIADGKYLCLISDGMGSGPEASKESKMTVDLVEKFIVSGFDINTALNAVNSIMTMKFDEDEKFSTLDMNRIDLYKGTIEFVKVGATSSFIKRGSEIIKISSNMPPFGLVDEIEVEKIEKKIKGGDIIITLSDGVLDVDKSKVGDTEWIESFLCNSGNDPKELAIELIEESKRLNNGSINDDMTVIVSKVQRIH
ncbi:MAG: stage II sporulation protein E [Clostridium sp.]|uniref:stage II sporulation protein E n=1 Tax=Clostridium sp. TaxID=1506 RepID=UPI003EE5360E